MRVIQMLMGLCCMLTTEVAANAKSLPDACALHRVSAEAQVTTSHGDRYRVESVYRDVAHNRINFIRDSSETQINIEGPVVWTSQGEQATLGTEADAQFVLGHQMHAIVIDALKTDPSAATDHEIQWRGETTTGWLLDFIPGGQVTIVAGNKHPLQGISIALPGQSQIDILLYEWRAVNGTKLPFHIDIHHAGTVYEYRYDLISIEQSTLREFLDAGLRSVPAEAELYRIHARSLGAHCEGDSAALADLASTSALIVQDGAIIQTSRDAIRDRFTSVFEAVSYQHYIDLVPPIISVNDDRTSGFLIANVRAITKHVSGEALSTDWSWMMTINLTEGNWSWRALSSGAKR